MPQPGEVWIGFQEGGVHDALIFPFFLRKEFQGVAALLPPEKWWCLRSHLRVVLCIVRRNATNTGRQREAKSVMGIHKDFDGSRNQPLSQSSAPKNRTKSG